MKKTLIELMTATRADDVHIHIGWRRPSGLGRGRACLDVFILGPVRSALTCVAGWAAGWLAHGPRNQMQGRSRQGKQRLGEFRCRPAALSRRTTPRRFLRPRQQEYQTTSLSGAGGQEDWRERRPTGHRRLPWQRRMQQRQREMAHRQLGSCAVK